MTRTMLKSQLVIHETKSTLSVVLGDQLSPDLDSMASRHTSPNVGGDTLGDNTAKNNLLIEP